MSGTPVFIHSNKRTGGSALVGTLRRSDRLCLYYDPLNAHLTRPWTQARTVGPRTWYSGHPDDMGTYFIEYEPLVVNDQVPGVPRDELANYVLGPLDHDDELRRYLGALIDHAQSRGRRPVFKTEQMEGRIGWLRATFPGSVHIGLVRSKAGQFASWLDQVMGINNTWFFEHALRVVRENPDFFGTHELPAHLDQRDWDLLVRVFTIYWERTTQVRVDDTDLALDMSPESGEPVEQQLRALRELFGDGAQPWVEAFTLTRETAPAHSRQPPAIASLKRFHQGYARVMGELMQISAERDAAVMQLHQMSEQLAQTERRWASAETRNRLLAEELEQVRKPVGDDQDGLAMAKALDALRAERDALNEKVLRFAARD